MQDYDGFTIPFDDNYFDIVFSSNVLEHIPHVVEFQKELHRVLKPSGKAVHLLPSSRWRLYTNITHIIKYWAPSEVHGEFAKNATTEMFYFSVRWWTKLFHKTGWTISQIQPNKLAYTGTHLMDNRISINTRSKLSRFLGSSCNVFVLTTADNMKS